MKVTKANLKRELKYIKSKLLMYGKNKELCSYWLSEKRRVEDLLKTM